MNPLKVDSNRMQRNDVVAIIGAGVAGCAMAGALIDYGIEFVVYDKNKRAGGLWADNYPDAAVQSTPELYEYPCKKFPSHIRNRKDPPGPTASEVCDYLDEYIDEKGMRSNFRFGTIVSSIEYHSDKEWIIRAGNSHASSSKTTFSFVIICTGLVSSKPNMIHIPGSETFVASGGKILHSSQRRSNDDIFGAAKQILVIGNGKSAADASQAAANIAKATGGPPPILLAQNQTWYVPRYLLGVLQYKWAFHTRLGSALLPRHFETTAVVLVLLHAFFAPIKWILWRLVEVLLLLQYRLPFRLWPSMFTIETSALEASVLITDETHLGHLRSGDIDMRIATLQALKPGKALLSTGETVDVDVVILATGWKLSCCDLFRKSASPVGSLPAPGLDVEEDGLWLYRNILPAGVKGLAFVGSNTLTFMNIYTSYIQAFWLAPLLAGKRPWPTKEHMKDTIQRDKVFKRSYYPTSSRRAASIEAYMQHYHDALFQEMEARRPFPSMLVRPLADLLVPVLPSLMEGCLEPIAKAKGCGADRTNGHGGKKPKNQ